MEHPSRLLILPVVGTAGLACLLIAGWAKAKLPDKPALAEAISTALFWLVMIGSTIAGLWIAGKI
jgi:hypothetical protein